MRAGAIVLVMCATSSACKQVRDQPAATPDSPAIAPVAQVRFHPVRALADLPQPALAAAELEKARADGIAFSEFEGSIPAELTILNDTAHEVQTIARLRFYAMPDGGFTDTIWVRRANLFGEMERASHEHYGLQAAARHGTWTRVNYAYDSAGVAQRGWVRIVPGKVMYASYDSLMTSHITQLADPAAARFFNQPNGQLLRISLEPSHSLDVVELRPQWVRVALTVPDTTECTGDPSARVTRRDTVWVPRINASGRRQLLAAVAGC